MRFFIFLLIAFWLLVPFAKATHEPDENGDYLESYYCVDNQIWWDKTDGDHEMIEDCDTNGLICENAGCISPDKASSTEDTPGDTVSPDASPIPGGDSSTPASTPVGAETTHENALKRLNRGTLPNLGKSEPSLGDKIKDALSGFFSSFGFNIVASLFPAYSQNAQRQNQAQIPIDAQDNTGNPVEQTSKDLGGDTGVYSVVVPRFVRPKSEKVEDYEEAYSKSNFLPGVNPFKYDTK